MKRTDEKLKEAVRLSIEGVVMQEIGRRLGVSRRTVLRWLADPALKALIVNWSRLFKERKARDWRRRQNAEDQVRRQVWRQKIKVLYFPEDL